MVTFQLFNNTFTCSSDVSQEKHVYAVFLITYFEWAFYYDY